MICLHLHLVIFLDILIKQIIEALLRFIVFFFVFLRFFYFPVSTMKAIRKKWPSVREVWCFRRVIHSMHELSFSATSTKKLTLQRSQLKLEYEQRQDFRFLFLFFWYLLQLFWFCVWWNLGLYFISSIPLSPAPA